MAGGSALRRRGMREPSDDELAAFDAMAFQDGRFARPVQHRLREGSGRDGRGSRRRFRTATDSGAVLSASSATATTTAGNAVPLVVVVVVDDELRRRCRRRRSRRKLVRRWEEKFFENGRAGRVPLVVDSQRLGGDAMLGPAASKRFVEGAPSGQDFWRHVIPPAGQEWSGDAAAGIRRQSRGHKSAPRDGRSGRRNLVVLLEGSRTDPRRDGRRFGRRRAVTS